MQTSILYLCFLGLPYLSQLMLGPPRLLPTALASIQGKIRKNWVEKVVGQINKTIQFSVQNSMIFEKFQKNIGGSRKQGDHKEFCEIEDHGLDVR